MHVRVIALRPPHHPWRQVNSHGIHAEPSEVSSEVPGAAPDIEHSTATGLARQLGEELQIGSIVWVVTEMMADQIRVALGHRVVGVTRAGYPPRFAALVHGAQP